MLGVGPFAVPGPYPDTNPHHMPLILIFPTELHFYNCGSPLLFVPVIERLATTKLRVLCVSFKPQETMDMLCSCDLHKLLIIKKMLNSTCLAESHTNLNQTDLI